MPWKQGNTVSQKKKILLSEAHYCRLHQLQNVLGKHDAIKFSSVSILSQNLIIVFPMSLSCRSSSRNAQISHQAEPLT